MNRHVTGRYGQMTHKLHVLNFHPHFREIVVLSIFYKIHDEKCSLGLLVQEDVNMAYEPSIFWSMFMLHKYW